MCGGYVCELYISLYMELLFIHLLLILIDYLSLYMGRKYTSFPGFSPLK